MVNEIKINQEFIFEAKAEVSLTTNGDLLFVAYTPYGKFSIFETGKQTNFYQGMSGLVTSGEKKIFYIQAKARKLVGNQYGDRAEFIKDPTTREPMINLLTAPELVNLSEMKKEVTQELIQLESRNERYSAFIKYALSKTMNPQNSSFTDVPAGLGGAYSFKGGLLTHTVRMLKRIEQDRLLNESGLFQLQGTRLINYDLLKVCAFLHEIGKCQVYTVSFSGTPEKTLKGKLNHHLKWTGWEVHRLLEVYNVSATPNLRLSEAEKLIILDVVSSSHYVEGREDVSKPKTKEAHLFNKLDYADHKFADIEMAEHENQGKYGMVRVMGDAELFIGNFEVEATQLAKENVSYSSYTTQNQPTEQEVSVKENHEGNEEQVLQAETPQVVEQSIEQPIASVCENIQTPVVQQQQTLQPVAISQEYTQDVFMAQQQWYNHATTTTLSY